MGAESAPTFTIWGRKAPPYIINDGFKGKIPYKFFENCRLVKSIPFLKALRLNMFCETVVLLSQQKLDDTIEIDLDLEVGCNQC